MTAEFSVTSKEATAPGDSVYNVVDKAIVERDNGSCEIGQHIVQW